LKIPHRSKQAHSSPAVSSLWEKRQETGIRRALSTLRLRETSYRKRLTMRAMGYVRQPHAKEAYDILRNASGGKDYVHFPEILLECAITAEPAPKSLQFLFDREALKKRLAAVKLLRETVTEIRDLQTFPFVREDALSSLSFGPAEPPLKRLLSWTAGGVGPGLLQLFGPEEMRARGASVLPRTPDAEAERMLDDLVDLFAALVKRSSFRKTKDGRPPKGAKNRLLLSLHGRFVEDFRKPPLPAIAKLIEMTFGVKSAKPSVLSSTISRLKSPKRRKSARRRP
jgi:hypothetical protein